MKTIVCKCFIDENSVYDRRMEVIYSDHKTHKVGDEIDFDDLDFANKDGYIVTVYP